MASDGEPGPVNRVLTLDQQAEAFKVYRHLLTLKSSDIRLALVHIEDEIGIHAVGRRANVARLLAAI